MVCLRKRPNKTMKQQNYGRNNKTMVEVTVGQGLTRLN